MRLPLYLKLVDCQSSSFFFRLEFSGSLVLEFPVLHETSLFCSYLLLCLVLQGCRVIMLVSEDEM